MFLKRVVQVVVLAGALCLAAVPAFATADVANPDNLSPLPDYKTEMSQDDFVAASKVMEEKTAGDKLLSYRIRVPNEWTRVAPLIDKTNLTDGKDSILLSRKLLTELARYVGAEAFEEPSRLEVHALDLDYKVSALNWFQEFVIKNGFVIEGIKQTNENTIHGLYYETKNGHPYVVRTVVFINGSRLIMASYYLPEARFETERGMQDWVMTSMQLLTPQVFRTDVNSTYSFLDLVEFDYPKNWRLVAPQISSMEGMDAKLINATDKRVLKGEINVRIVSTELETSLPLEIQYLKEQIRVMGLEVGDLLDREKPSLADQYQFHPHINYARVEVYSAKPHDKSVQDHEYWLSIMAEDRYYYIISMLTPSRTADFYGWARNTEAYETVIESIRP